MDHFGYIPDPPKAQSPQPPTGSDSAWVLSRLEMILSGYRKADYHNPEAFMAQAATNLSKYPPEIIEFVSAPTTGIQTRSQWPPSLAEIIAACEAEVAHREKVARYSSMGPALPRLPRPRYSADQSYEIMAGKHGRPIGPFENGREHPYDAR